MLEVIQNQFQQHQVLVFSVWGIVTILLIIAAVIDGIQLKVPNWLTFPMILSGLVVSTIVFGWEGLQWSFLGMLVGLGCLLPLYAIGGMGAGDVKLLAGVGAWVGVTQTLWAFVLTAIFGAIIAIVMVIISKKWRHHQAQFLSIMSEIMVIRSPEKLSTIAAERKPSMMLLPYGIPIAIGTIVYFAYLAVGVI